MAFNFTVQVVTTLDVLKPGAVLAQRSRGSSQMYFQSASYQPPDMAIAKRLRSLTFCDKLKSSGNSSFRISNIQMLQNLKFSNFQMKASKIKYVTKRVTRDTGFIERQKCDTEQYT